tara:strand:+ start:307 stop:507 length:201 start_codon:yes stop_codon:yes gene_type:complete
MKEQVVEVELQRQVLMDVAQVDQEELEHLIILIIHVQHMLVVVEEDLDQRLQEEVVELEVVVKVEV